MGICPHNGGGITTCLQLAKPYPMHLDPRTILENEGRLMVWVTPGARRSEIVGFVTGPHDRQYLKLKVTAPPEDGRANEAVIRLLADTCGLARSRLAIVNGQTTPFKRVAYTP